MGSRASCFVCGRRTYDPIRGERPWARGVARGELALICPRCQAEGGGWADALDRCPACESPRLSVTLGQIVCRACGHAAS